MAKQLDWVSLAVSGDQTDPSSATFTYCISESADTSMKKTATYVPASPDFNQSLSAFWDAHVATIKTNEGVSP